MKKTIGIILISMLSIYFLFGTSSENKCLAQYNTYFVGHSMFGYSQPNLVGAMLQDLAIDAGVTGYDYGDQIIGGSCLSIQWEDHNISLTGDSWIDIPAGNSSGQYDMLVVTELIPITEALDPNLAPWTGCNLTPYEALDNFHDLTKQANPNTKIYLMESHNEADFDTGNPTTAQVFMNWSNLNTGNRPLWEHVADSVSQTNNNAQICIIPVAAASTALADSIINNNFPGITNFIDMFEPTDGNSWKIHFTDLTTYLSACVHFATLFQQSPIGLTNELAGRTVMAGTAPTPSQALVMQQIAWQIVNNDTRATSCWITTDLESNINEDKNLDKDFMISPNPSNGRVLLSGLKELNYTEIRVIDINGRIVKSLNYNSIGQKENIELEIKRNGIYFVHIIDKGLIKQTEKLIINKM